MAARALARRPALNRMFSDLEESWVVQGGKLENRPAILDEKLSPAEWNMVAILQKILQPFKIASKQLQGDGVLGVSTSSGSFDEYFPVIEMLLDHLETASQGYIIEEDQQKQLIKTELFDHIDEKSRKLLQVYVKLGWKKLDEYYSKLTGTAYIAAVVFNPCKKWAALDRLWDQLPERQTAGWKREYQKSLVSIWKARYENIQKLDEGGSVLRDEAGSDFIERRLAFSRALPVSQVRSSSGQSGQNVPRKRTTEALEKQSELEQYLDEPSVNTAAYRRDPIAWWRDIGSKRFPRLSYMAVDFLTIPSSSAETERDFSSCGRMIVPLRTRLRRHIIGMAQCLRSWSKVGIYTPSLPLAMLEGENWREALQMVSKVFPD